MREQILKKIETAILAAYPVGSSYTRNQLVQSTIPHGIRHFLLSTLERRAELEASQLLKTRSEWFDETDEEYLSVIQQTVLALRHSAKFPVEEWSRAVRQAAESVLEYLVSPTQALTEFIFSDGSGSISTIDLQRRAGYFSDYPYITKSVDAFLSRRNELRITRSEFESTLSHLDSQITTTYEIGSWMSLLRPLVSLIGITGQASEGIPVDFAVHFFESKRQNAIAEAIASAAFQHHAKMITTSSLETIIRSQLSVIAEAEIAQKTLFDVENPEPLEDAAPKEEATPEATDAPTPLWKRFQMDEEEDSGEDNSGKSDEPLWKKFESKKADPTQTSSSEVESEGRPDRQTSQDQEPEDEPIPVFEAVDSTVERIVLGAAVERRDRYVRDLFQSDEKTFCHVLDQLAASPDWTSASAIIADQVFRPFQVDIYSEIAVDFTDAVESRYSGTTTD